MSLFLSGMASLDHFFEVGYFDAGVALGGDEALVAEKTLDLTDVGVSFEKMRRAAMSQHMRCELHPTLFPRVLTRSVM